MTNTLAWVLFFYACLHLFSFPSRPTERNNLENPSFVMIIRSQWKKSIPVACVKENILSFSLLDSQTHSQRSKDKRMPRHGPEQEKSALPVSWFHLHLTEENELELTLP
jgi:hypothetical protein